MDDHARLLKLIARAVDAPDSRHCVVGRSLADTKRLLTNAGVEFQETVDQKTLKLSNGSLINLLTSNDICRIRGYHFDTLIIEEPMVWSQWGRSAYDHVVSRVIGTSAGLNRGLKPMVLK